MIIGRVFIGAATIGFAIAGSLIGLSLRSEYNWPIWACMLLGFALVYVGSVLDREY